MSKMKLNLKKSENLRKELTKRQEREIVEMYQKVQRTINDDLIKLSKKTNVSSIVKKSQLERISKKVQKELDSLSEVLEIKVKDNIKEVSKGVIEDNKKLLKDMKLRHKEAWQYVPDDVLKSITSGSIYKEGWGLSKRIWGIQEKTMKDIHSVIAEGVALNKSSFDIAKDLEKYVSPSAKKTWSWSKVYPGTNKKIDYNAQRLARTLVSHAYQQSFVKTTEKNPFIEKYRWHSALAHERTCEICKERDDKLFDKDSLPLDHPNGLCTFSAEITKSYEQIANEIANWKNSPEGTNPGLDEFAKSLGYKPKDISKVKDIETKVLDKTNVIIDANDFVNKYGKSKKSWSAWVKSLDGEMKEHAKMLKAKDGLTWEKWYNKNIFDGDSNLKSVKVKSTLKGTKDDYKNWINNIKKNKESNMLKWEDELFNKFTGLEQESIRKYTGSSYIDINNYLRKKAAGVSARLSDMKKEVINNMKKALSKSKLEEDLFVRRGTDLGDLAGLFMKGNFDDNRNKLLDLTVNELNKMFNGSIGEYAGFTSTSSLYDRGFSGHVETIIKIPKEADAASIMRISNYGTSEGETLLNAGTKVRCLGIEKADGHKRSKIRVFLEVMV